MKTLQYKVLREITASKEVEEESTGQVYGLFGIYHYTAHQKLCIFKSRAVISLLLCGTALWIMEL